MCVLWHDMNGVIAMRAGSGVLEVEGRENSRESRRQRAERTVATGRHYEKMKSSLLPRRLEHDRRNTRERERARERENEKSRGGGGMS